MDTTASGTFRITGWDESEVHTGEGQAKMSVAHVTCDYSGDMEGKGAVEYVMAYSGDGTAQFVAMERFEGSLGGKSGSFVIRVAGEFRDGAAMGERVIVAGSGTGELEGVGGEGSFRAEHGAPEASWELLIR
ncbi:MAG: DUF3224 domain-containing protein [Planctomycetota bacterium]|jgi:hypothetical protein